MRVLFSVVPESGHLNPLLPLARALADAGHEVRFASSPGFARRAERAGFAASPVGQELDAWFAELARREGGTPGEGLAPEEIEGWFVPRLFAEIGAVDTLGDLRALIEGWRPRLVVHDTYQLAAPLVAALAGIPNVAHGLGPLAPLEVYERAGAAVAPLWQEHGLLPPAYAGLFAHACLTISPPSLDVTLPDEPSRRVLQLRPVGYDGGGSRVDPPVWLADLLHRPLIYGTLGTFLNTDRAVFRAMLDGLEDQEVSLVVTVGENHDPDWVGAAPANARVERYIPQSLLLDRCAALISHGGSGTILPALARGIPLVLVPQGADNFTNAAHCERAGVGLTLRPGEVSAGAIRSALRRVLEDAAFRENASRVAAEIAAMPRPEAVVGQLFELAAQTG